MARRGRDREEEKFEDIPSVADPAFPETQVPSPLKAAVRTIDVGEEIVVAADGTPTVVSTGELDTCVSEDSVVADRFYVGKAPIGTATSAAAWQIKRITVASPGGILDVDIGWADSNRAFDNVFDSREALTYSK